MKTADRFLHPPCPSCGARLVQSLRSGGSQIIMCQGGCVLDFGVATYECMRRRAIKFNRAAELQSTPQIPDPQQIAHRERRDRDHVFLIPTENQ